MKHYFSSDLRGGKIFLALFLLVLVVMGYIGFMTCNYIDQFHEAKQVRDGLLLPTTVFSPEYLVRFGQMIGVMAVLYLAVIAAFFFIAKFTLNSISFKGERIETDLNFGHFAPRVLGQIALTIVTLGIYSPWFSAWILRYFAARTEYRGERFRFNNGGSILFAVQILCAVVMVVVVAIWAALYFMAMPTVMTNAPMPHQSAMLLFMFNSFLVLSIVVLAVCFITAFTLRWMVEYDWNGKLISAAAKMRTLPATFFVLGQILLCFIVPLGLYMPAAQLQIMRYVARHTQVVGREGGTEGMFGLDFTFNDYLYVLGQTLLGYITLGIYIPFGYARIMRRIAAKVYFMDFAADSPHS